MTKRLFPKCFKSNFHAVTFHDLVTEKYPELKTHNSFSRLCKEYTCLLCAIHSLQQGGEVEKVRRKFQRFTLLSNYSECGWDLLFTTFRRSIGIHSRQLWNEMSPADVLQCQETQTQLEDTIFEFFGSVLSTNNEKLKLV